MSLRFAIEANQYDLLSSEEISGIQAVYERAFPSLCGLVEVQLVSLQGIQNLNAQYRDLDEPTDVLSFPTIEHPLAAEIPLEPDTPLGTIVICPEKATLYQERIIDLVHHGLLHLLGFDHEQDRVQWDEEELRVMEHAAALAVSLHPLPYDQV